MSDKDDLGVDELAALAKQLDQPSPDMPRVELMRASLLRAAADDRREPKARWPLLAGGFGAGAFAAAATAMIALHHPAAIDQPRAQIEASTAADFDRTITRDASGTDEAVRLHAGRISLAVAELPSGDHVRVVARDGEIEGAGLYEVSVVDDAIKEVSVKRGTAHVRLVGQHEVFLATGQIWKAPIATADLSPNHDAVIADDVTRTQPPSKRAGNGDVARGATPSDKPVANETRGATPDVKQSVRDVAPAAPIHTETPIVRAPAMTDSSGSAAQPAVPALHTMADASPGETPPNAINQIAKSEKKPMTALEQHFATGWSLLRAGKSGEAARELALAAETGGDDPLAGDARYFEAIALTQAGRKTEAEHTLVEFMDRAPHAVRRGRAAVMLGRLIAERGDKATARTWFESATHDPDANVAAAAKAELAK